MEVNRKGNDHILQLFDEKYYVPSLLWPTRWEMAKWTAYRLASALKNLMEHPRSKDAQAKAQAALTDYHTGITGAVPELTRAQLRQLKIKP